MNTSQLARPSWLPEDRWPFAIRRFDYSTGHGDPLAIHYTDEGVGPTLVFVHAGMWSFVWRDAIDELRNDHRCISIDFPGTGLSDGSGHDIDIATYPDILNALLDHRGVERATFVVHDLGGVVGVIAAGNRPERAEGLVASNSFAWPPAQRALRAMLSTMGSRPMIATLGTLRVIPRLSRTKAGVGRHFDKTDRLAFYGPYRARQRSRNFHRTMRSASKAGPAFQRAEAAMRGPLSALPVLTVFGENNDQFDFAAKWKGLFPHAAQWTVEGGNHFPMCDDPSGFCRRLREWRDLEPVTTGDHASKRMGSRPA